MKNSNERTTKRLYFYVAVLVAIFACLFAISFAVSWSSTTATAAVYSSSNAVENIDINGGKPVIGEDEFILEPGMNISKDFYIANNGEAPAYYGFTEVSGNLSGIIDVTLVSDGNAVFSGKAEKLDDIEGFMNDIIPAGCRKNFVITFSYPESAGNKTQNQELNFTLYSDFTE